MRDFVTIGIFLGVKHKKKAEKNLKTPPTIRDQKAMDSLNENMMLQQISGCFEITTLKKKENFFTKSLPFYLESLKPSKISGRVDWPPYTETVYPPPINHHNEALQGKPPTKNI